MKRGSEPPDALVARVVAMSRPELPTPALLDVRAAAAFLTISESTVERLVRREGLPYLDLSARVPGRRARRLLRFDPAAVLAWARNRANGNGGGAP